MPIVYDDHSSDFTLEVLADDAPSLQVSSWEGREAISAPFSYVLTAGLRAERRRSRGRDREAGQDADPWNP